MACLLGLWPQNLTNPMTVLLLPSPESDNAALRVFRVPDPRTRAPMTVVGNPVTGALYELQVVRDDLGSWFIGDSVKSGKHQQSA